MKFTAQKHFDQKTSVFTLINLFTQHQCKTNLNRSPVIQIFLLSVTFSALVVASNFLFALQLSKVEPLLQSVVILHQSSVLLLYYCLSKGRMNHSCVTRTSRYPAAPVDALGRARSFHTTRNNQKPGRMSREKHKRACGHYRNGGAGCRLSLHAWDMQEGFSSSWHRAVQAAFACCKRGTDTCQDSHRLCFVDKALCFVSVSRAGISMLS